MISSMWILNRGYVIKIILILFCLTMSGCTTILDSTIGPTLGRSCQREVQRLAIADVYVSFYLRNMRWSSDVKELRESYDIARKDAEPRYLEVVNTIWEIISTANATEQADGSLRVEYPSQFGLFYPKIEEKAQETMYETFSSDDTDVAIDIKVFRKANKRVIEISKPRKATDE